MRWDELTPTERDAVVAEKVMGWQYVHDAPDGYFCDIAGNDMGWWKAPGSRSWSCAFCNGVPSYSTDISAAWVLAESLDISKEPGVGTVRLLRSQNGHWTAAFVKNLWETEWADALTAPDAICKAALKAVGVDLEHIPRETVQT